MQISWPPWKRGDDHNKKNDASSDEKCDLSLFEHILDFEGVQAFSDLIMKLQQPQIEKLVRSVFDRLKSKDLIQFKSPEKQVFERAMALVAEDFKLEDDLNAEVNRMLDELERQNVESFDRRKMYGLLKQKLAKQKGIVLWF